EELIGEVVRERGGFPEHTILSTKIDRDFETRHLDAARARRSLEISLTKLGVDRIDILHLHDPEHCADLDEIVRKGGAMDELFKMKDEGLASAVGLAMGSVPLMSELLPRWEFDALINHNRWTLLNRTADRMYSDAHDRGIAILNAAPYAGGVFAKGSHRSNRITYQVVTDEAMSPVRRIEEICARHGVPTGAVALQFSIRDPRVASTIVGVSKPERISQSREWADLTVPDACWNEILALPVGNDDPEAGRDIRA
ncbi:MAG: aldo/keto reductase, partial [Albidovulum sp.]|nr:aldo/keto reductase [Albidovulum sp.]